MPHQIPDKACTETYPDCVGCPYLNRGCTDSVPPVQVWASACEGAIRAVEMVNFEKQADTALEEAKKLMTLALTLKGGC